MLLPVHGIERPTEIFTRAGLYLDENECVIVAADEVDFAAMFSPEVAVENLVTLPPEIACGQLFPPRAELKMLGTRTRKAAAPPVRMIGDESDKARAHEVSRGVAACRNLCAD